MNELVDSDDWRTKCKGVSEMIAETRKRALFVDVSFLVGQPPSNRHFKAHKMMLASGSPVFEAMLFGPLAEQKDPVVIPGDDPDAFEIMLQHLYGEGIVFPSIVAACKSYYIGDKYLIPHLRSKSADFIRASTMDEENFWGVIEGGLLLNNRFLEEKFCSYIQSNASKLIKCKEFLYVPEYVVATFLRMETMEVSEYELLKSVTKWCLKKFGQEAQSKTDHLFRTYMQYIRFSVLTPKEFCLFTEKFPVLDNSTSLKILKHLNDPSNYDLPVWCSVKKVVRNRVKTEQAPFRINVNVNAPARLPPTARLGRTKH